MMVLLVEDDPMNLALQTVLLELGGHTVRQARSGEEALELAAQVRPDLVVMDVSLPRMDGFETARRLRLDPSTRTIPVVAASGHRRSEISERASQAGCVGLISKPIDARHFVEQVEDYLLAASR